MMRRLVERALLVGVLSLCVSGVQANDALLPGAKPSSTQRLSVWGFDVYDARLLTQTGFTVQNYADH